MASESNKGCAIHYSGKNYHCSISMAMDLVGGKWKGGLFCDLQEKPKRFSELKRCMPDITEMTQSLQLKQLQRDGLISRTVKGDKLPIQVIYALTEEGQLLSPIMTLLSGWAKNISLSRQ